MTRQHFKAIADAVKSMDVNDETRAIIARALSDAIHIFNSGFRPQTFLSACGVDE